MKRTLPKIYTAQEVFNKLNKEQQQEYIEWLKLHEDNINNLKFNTMLSEDVNSNIHYVFFPLCFGTVVNKIGIEQVIGSAITEKQFTPVMFPDYTPYNLFNLGDFTLPDSVNVLHRYSFLYNDTLLSINLNKCKCINDAVFLNCSNLTEITLLTDPYISSYRRWLEGVDNLRRVNIKYCIDSTRAPLIQSMLDVRGGVTVYIDKVNNKDNKELETILKNLSKEFNTP